MVNMNQWPKAETQTTAWSETRGLSESPPLHKTQRWATRQPVRKTLGQPAALDRYDSRLTARA
jgi:hypothetical protein